MDSGLARRDKASDYIHQSPMAIPPATVDYLIALSAEVVADSGGEYDIRLIRC